MRTSLLALVVALGACGAAPDKPVLANAPRPDQAYVAGAAAAVSAAIVLATPDVTRTPEKNKNEEKAPVRVKESVPGDVLDRLDRAPATTPDAQHAVPAAENKEPSRPKDPLDFSSINSRLKRVEPESPPAR